MDDAEYVVERHKMSRTQMRALKNLFQKQCHRHSYIYGESYTKEWEQAMQDDEQEAQSERFSVLEFWATWI